MNFLNEILEKTCLLNKETCIMKLINILGHSSTSLSFYEKTSKT